MFVVTTTSIRYHNLLCSRLRAIGLAPVIIGWLRIVLDKVTINQIEDAAENAGVPIAAITITEET